MSLKEALQSFIDHLKAADSPIYFTQYDDVFLFIINILENLYDFHNLFDPLKEKYQQDKNIKNNFIMEYVLNQKTIDQSQSQNYLLLIVATKNLTNLLELLADITQNPNLKEEYYLLFDQLQSINYQVKCPLVEDYKKKWSEIEIMEDFIIDANDPIYLWQQACSSQEKPQKREKKLGIINLELTDFQFQKKDFETEDQKQEDSKVFHLSQFDDITTINSTPVKDEKYTNSQKLYDASFDYFVKNYQYNNKPIENSLQDQDFKCKSCLKQISKGFYIAFNNSRYCFYTGFWYCTSCISQDKYPIPYLALEQFDLRSYNVCKQAELEIQQNYSFFINQIDTQWINLFCLLITTILQFIKTRLDFQENINSQILYEFMIIKRQVHLVYDKICDLQLIHDLFKDYLNLAIKPNLFSMQNLYEIYNNILNPKISQYLTYLIQHIKSCEVCQKRGKICQICKNKEKIFNFDLKNTQVCEKCKYIYHRECLEKVLCPRCQLD